MIKIEKLWVTRTLQFLLVIIEPILRKHRKRLKTKYIEKAALF